jgi:DNA end-binding protein Ku
VPEARESDGRGLRPFWSGTIAFGLVSLPVSLFVANRGRRVSLRMVDADGTPLSRRYYCPAEQKSLSNDEIVRGYEVAKDEFVWVSDEELDALAPEKSQEIDLRRFVPLSEIDPVYFERAYFLAPDQGASKAYRLLAKVMEEEGLAGIATFVMRGKEYLVAIIAERGILRAETLRFADELRTPEYVDLPRVEKADAERVRAFEREMRALSSIELDRNLLSDCRADRLLELVRRKLEAGDDVVAAPEQLEPQEGDEVVDLMQVLKQSLTEVSGDGEEGAEGGRGARKRGGREAGRKKPEGGLSERSKAELYERAKELDISGRSGMTKEQLIDAIRHPR